MAAEYTRKGWAGWPCEKFQRSVSTVHFSWSELNDGWTGGNESSHQALRSADTIGVRAAMGDMLRIPVAEQGPELRAAIVDALLSQREGDASLRDGHVVAELADAVLETARAGDPVAIPALVAFPTVGWRTYWALVSLGEPALRAVLDAASSPASDEGTVFGALHTLTMFVDEWGLGAFDEPTYEKMKSVVGRNLQGPTYWTLLRNSIGLAVLLGPRPPGTS